MLTYRRKLIIFVGAMSKLIEELDWSHLWRLDFLSVAFIITRLINVWLLSEPIGPVAMIDR